MLQIDNNMASVSFFILIGMLIFETCILTTNKLKENLDVHEKIQTISLMNSLRMSDVPAPPCFRAESIIRKLLQLEDIFLIIHFNQNL